MVVSSVCHGLQLVFLLESGTYEINCVRSAAEPKPAKNRKVGSNAGQTVGCDGSGISVEVTRLLKLKAAAMEPGDVVMVRRSYLLGCRVSELMPQLQKALQHRQGAASVSDITPLREPAHQA